jgi:Cys-rich protein (TIGR01571 family)
MSITGSWAHPLFSFFEEPGPCVLASTAGVLGVAVIQLHNRITSEHEAGVQAFLCALCLPGCGSAYNRTKLRRRYGITGSYGQDCLLHCCLPLCAVVQEYREVKHQISPLK